MLPLALLILSVAPPPVEVFATPLGGSAERFFLMLDMKSRSPFGVRGAVAQFRIEQGGKAVGPTQPPFRLTKSQYERSVTDLSKQHQTRFRNGHLDRSGLTPGLYTLSGTVTLDLFGPGRRWKQTKRIFPTPLYLPPEGSRAENRFSMMAGVGVPLKDREGREITTREYLMREWTLLRTAREGRWFSIEGVREEVLLPNGMGPSLWALFDDAELTALRRRYVGKPVWMYGGTWAYGIGADTDYGSVWQAPHDSPAQIRGIYRTTGYGQVSSARHDIEAPSYLTAGPLHVVLDLPPDAKLASGWLTGRFGDPDVAREPSMYSTFYIGAGGAWDLERLVSLINPFDARPIEEPGEQGLVGSWDEWERMSESIRRRSPRLSMRMEHVLWMRGWPSTLRPLQDLRRQSTWTYRQTSRSERFEFGKYDPSEPPRLTRYELR